ncbi:MAG: hypothetical protein C0508_20635 [Cyanobacteria bacterium PR.023]|nr:hypothetical protein [Cyanobacteria bacterium PR.023]
MKFMSLVGMDAEEMKSLFDENERVYEDYCARGMVKEAKISRALSECFELLVSFSGSWSEVRILQVQDKLNRSRFRTDPVVLLERQELEAELLELEKAQRLDRNVGVLARCLLLGLTAVGTLLIGFEGLILEPEGILSVAACWSLVLFLCWIYRDERSKT